MTLSSLNSKIAGGLLACEILFPGPGVRVHIPAPHGRLEAHLREAESRPRGIAVVCHPHPLYGGTMHTKAVFRAAQALSEVGFHALRFNFRGVGTSTGSFADGVGEREDVRAALAWVHENHPALPVVLGGFSFGSMVALKAGAEDERVQAFVGLGLAVSKWDYGFLAGFDRPTLIVQGEEDEFGTGEAVASALAAAGPSVTLRRIAGSGHYFDDHFDELQEVIRGFFTSGPGAKPFPVTGDGSPRGI